jgi:hypothetical protein
VHHPWKSPPKPWVVVGDNVDAENDGEDVAMMTVMQTDET